MRPIATFALSILFMAAGAAHAADAPTPEQVQEWWTARSAEMLTLDGPLQEVHLMDKEVAYIAPVGFYGRGRNFIWHAVLVRPALREVRELPQPVGNQNIAVLDLDGDGVSEVVTESVASGQGSTERLRSIVRFDGFTPIILHAVEEEDNLGWCRKACDVVRVEWKFGQQSTTDLRTLTEKVTTSKGPTEDRMQVRSETRRYVLMGNVFVRADAQELRYPDEVERQRTGQGE